MYDDHDILLEKLRRIWKFWFCLSLGENAIGSTLCSHQPYRQFHSLQHTLAGFEENQRLSTEFQELLYHILFWRPSQHYKITADPQMLHEKTHLPAFNPQKKHVIRLNSIMKEKYQKLCRHSKRKFSSNRATTTLRTGCAEISNSLFWSSVFCDCCASELHNASTPSPYAGIK